jgi:hypothetical protein
MAGIEPFKPAAACDEHHVIHLKGFAARLDFSDAATARQADALVDAVAAHKRSRPSLCVAWDGDAPSDESFTRLLRRCASLGCGLIAFCYAADEAAFRKAWGPEGLAIRGYVVDEPPDDVACRWAFLGVSALRATRATECLCLGGGPVALREFEGSAAAFVLYDVRRRPRDGAGAPERSALLERAPHERLRVVASDEPPRPPPPPNADVVVKTSRLPGAGLGLFAVRAFAVGELVCEYTGTVLDSAARSLEDKSYLMKLGQGVFVDARTHYEVHARYINDCRDKRVHNVSFDKRPAERRALVVAARPIAAGDELYASYGPLYWLGADMRGEPSARLPEPAVEALMAREREYWDGER